jgi:hypothetical protein
MSHLPAERLAALADHSHCPDLAITESEREHLDACVACTREVKAYRRLVGAALEEREREDRGEPLAPWAGIAAALRAEGLIADAEPRSAPTRLTEHAAPVAVTPLAVSTPVTPLPTRATRPTPLHWAGRIAAGLMLVTAGAAAGRATAGSAAVRATPVAGTDTIAAAANAAASTISGSTVRAASYVVDTATRFVNTAEALAALTSAERQYERAASFLVQHDSSAQPTDSTQLYRARLAALDNVMAATREALYDAPHDPLINRYYLATMGAREATIKQLGTSLPQGERISRY